MAQPGPGHPGARGVVLEGPVGHQSLGRWRTFRYEVRRWRDGILPDAEDAMGGPRRVSDDPQTAVRLLDLADSLPHLVWGRDQLGTGEMWNSNSVISWLLTMAGLPMTAIRPPQGSRAPGWDAGIAAAGRRVVPPGL